MAWSPGRARYDGLLDEVALWIGRALSADNATWLYNAGLARIHGDLTATNPGTANLAAYWPLDEQSGTRYDAQGSNDLTDVNTVGYATGKQGNAADFVAANAEYLSSAAEALNFGAGDFSFSLWLQPSSSLSTNYATGGRVIQRRGTGVFGSAAGWQFVVYKSGSNCLLTNSGFDDGSNSKAFAQVTLGAIGAWIHLVGVVDRTAGTMKLYADGSLVSTEDISAVTGSVNTARAFTLGASDVNPTQYFDGLMDEVSLWTGKALTEGEVAWLFNDGVARKHSDLGGQAANALLHRQMAHYRALWAGGVPVG